MSSLDVVSKCSCKSIYIVHGCHRNQVQKLKSVEGRVLFMTMQVVSMVHEGATPTYIAQNDCCCKYCNQAARVSSDRLTCKGCLLEQGNLLLIQATEALLSLVCPDTSCAVKRF